MKKLIAGNWKMNGNLDEARALVAGIINLLDGQDEVLKRADVLVCPPFLHIPAVRHAIHGFAHLKLGAQDCAATDNGAYTGEVSASMLADSACSYVILGHSERRQYFGETDASVQQKAERALEKDLIPIICVGETLEEREAGKADEVVIEQLQHSLPPLNEFSQIVVAYEPVWAIGTGKVARVDDVRHMHTLIRGELAKHTKNADKVRILYGGSMKPENAKELLATENVDGGLIGGASLKPEDFLAIAKASNSK